MRALTMLTILTILGACSTLPVPPDAGPQAIAAGDPTAILSGCGSPANVGYLYCRLAEGWIPTGEIRVNVPPVACGMSSCSSVVVYRPDGGRALDKAIPAGATSFGIPWTALLGTEAIDKRARGFWPVLLKWSWLNGDGVLEQAIAEGEIRVRVHGANYQPLGAEPSIWTWKLGTLTLRATEKGRAFVGSDSQ